MRQHAPRGRRIQAQCPDQPPLHRRLRVPGVLFVNVKRWSGLAGQHPGSYPATQHLPSSRRRPAVRQDEPHDVVRFRGKQAVQGAGSDDVVRW
jgi:hypothetical protein